MRIDPSGRYLYFVIANTRGPIIYRLPLHEPEATKLEIFHLYEPPPFPIGAPPGLVFGQSGKLYVMLGFANQVSVLRPDGTEEKRFPSPQENLSREVPYAFPCMAAFDGRGSLLVTNVGSPADPSQWVIFDVWVDDTAAPLARPEIP
jgi:sugar lactone lactonase YvrE